MSRVGTPTDNPIIEALNGWMKEALYLDFGLASAENVPLLLDEYVYYFKKDSTLKTEIKSEKNNTATMRFSPEVIPSYLPDRMTECVRDFKYIKTSLRIEIEMMLDDVGEFASSISEIRYEVPSFYDLADESELVETQIRASGIHRHTINTKGVDFDAAMKNGDIIGYDALTGTIIMKGHVKMHCIINTAHMNEYNEMDVPCILMRVTMGTLGTNEVTGRFEQSERVEVEPITFDDLPDLIKDEEVVIDVDNPIVRLTVDNEVPARALVNATLRAYRDETEIASLNIGEEFGTDSIKFEGGKKQTIWISRKPTEIPDSVSSNVVIENIMDLLKKMPDRIDIDGWAHTDSSQVVTMGLNDEYVVQPFYELVAPLVIGPSMKLVYTILSDDLHSTLKSLDINSLTVKARATNNIPLDLTATLTAKDGDGDEITGIILTQSQAIKGLDATDLELTLVGDIEDFQKVDKLEIKAYAESNGTLTGHALNKNQALRLEDIKVTVK